MTITSATAKPSFPATSTFRGTGVPPHVFPVDLATGSDSDSPDRRKKFRMRAAEAFRQALVLCGEVLASKPSAGADADWRFSASSSQLNELLVMMSSADERSFDVLWHSTLFVAEQLVMNARERMDSDESFDTERWIRRARQVAPSLALDGRTLEKLIMFMDGELDSDDNWLVSSPETFGAMLALGAAAAHWLTGGRHSAWSNELDQALSQMETDWLDERDSDWCHAIDPARSPRQ